VFSVSGRFAAVQGSGFRVEIPNSAVFPRGLAKSQMKQTESRHQASENADAEFGTLIGKQIEHSSRRAGGKRRERINAKTQRCKDAKKKIVWCFVFGRGCAERGRWAVSGLLRRVGVAGARKGFALDCDRGRARHG
jgi:hypothetical protein